MKKLIHVLIAICLVVGGALIGTAVLHPGSGGRRTAASDQTGWDPKKDEVAAAYLICDLVKSGGATQCSVSGWAKQIDMTISTSPAEARQMCAGMGSKVVGPHAPGIRGNGWEFRIFDPWSERPIATCRLL